MRPESTIPDQQTLSIETPNLVSWLGKIRFSCPLAKKLFSLTRNTIHIIAFLHKKTWEYAVENKMNEV